MKLQVEWSEPVRMRPASRQRTSGVRPSGLYVVDLDELPAAPGIYVLGRLWGRGFEALYVGQAKNIRRRLKSQLNNLRLMQHVHGAKTGRRVVFAGTFAPGPGQQVDRCLPIIERAFIRYFLLDGHDLVNIQGTRLRQHEVESLDGPRYLVPKVMYVDRSR